MGALASHLHAKAIGVAFATTLLAAAAPASAQTKASTSSAPKGVSMAACAVFEKYLTEEVDVAIDDVSKGFLLDADRFVASGCKSRDAKGEIHLVTRTNEDGRALRTARKRMGKIDILGDSGVAHCHRPEGGTCTAGVAASAPKKQAFAEPN